MKTSILPQEVGARVSTQAAPGVPRAPEHKSLAMELSGHFLPELQLLGELISECGSLAAAEVIGEVVCKGKTYPIVSVRIGSSNPSDPCFGLFAGVHGLERVGSHVAISFLQTLIQNLKWDQDLRNFFKHVRVAAIPVINPVGMHTHSRSNGNGVDLMRNAPVEVDDEARSFLLSGHRISPLLPWYRGKEGAPLEVEAKLLIDYVEKYLFPSNVSIALDLHSGFGINDRLWYPFAGTKRPFPSLHHVLGLKNLLRRTYRYHVYQIEQQTDSYGIAGDLWDYMYRIHNGDQALNKRIFLPWTLEMGSWTWVRKNPIQAFSRPGFFNPVKRHRYARVMRRHLQLLDFFVRAVRNEKAWA